MVMGTSLPLGVGAEAEAVGARVGAIEGALVGGPASKDAQKAASPARNDPELGACLQSKYKSEKLPTELETEVA